MSWQILLKAQPQRDITLLIALADDSKTDSLIEEIKDSETLSAGFKGLLRNIKGNNITVESMMKKLPLPNISKEKIEANLKKVLDSVKDEQVSETKALETLLDEAISAKNEGDEAKFAELSQKIKDAKGKSERNLRANKKLRAKMRVFDSFADGFVIEFKSIPSNAEEKKNFTISISEFAIQIGGEVKNDTIQTNLDSAKAVRDAIRQNDEARELYSEKIRQYKPDLEGQERTLSSVSETDTMLASNVSFTVREPFTSNNVLRYILALEAIGGDISKFEPKVMKNGFEFPSDAIFLERASGRKNSLALNPYGKLLITASFTGDSWFNDFFSAVRMNAFVSENLAERMFIDSIIEGLGSPNNPDKSSLGTNLIPFRDIKLTNNQKQDRKKIKNFLDKDTTLRQELNSQTSAYQRNVFQDKYQGKFTVKEAKAFQEIYDNTDDAEFIFGDLEIEYYDEFDKPISQGEKTDIAYAKIFLDDDETSPKELMEDIENKEKETGTKIGLGKLRQTMLDTSDFSQFIVDYSNNEEGGLTKLTESDASSATVMDKLSPKNSLIILSRLGEQGIMDEGQDGLIADTFISIDKNRENTSKQLELANELNDKMPQFLKEAKEELISGFKLRLEDFTKDYQDFFPYKQNNVPLAIKEFRKQQLIE